MTEETEAPRGVGALLRDRTFGPFIAGKLLSSCGVWIQNLTAAVLMFSLTRSAFMVGLVSALQFVPPLMLSLWAGALTDIVDRRKMLIVGRVLSGSALTTLSALLFVLGEDGFGGPPVLLAVIFVLGISLAVSNPAMQALIPALVPKQDLEQALAVNASAPGIARTLGPAMGAGLLLVGGPATAFVAAAACHLGFAATLLFLRGEPQVKPRSRPRLLGGVRYLTGNRAAGMLVIGAAMLGFGADAVVTLTPSLAAQMGGGDAVVGLFAAGFGVGGIIVALTLQLLRRALTLRLVGIWGFWVLAGGLVLVAASPNVPTGVAGFLVTGVGFMMGNVAINTRIQRGVPDELRGRVMALWGVAFFGFRPLTALVNGTLADLFSVQVALLVAAVATVLASPLSRARDA